MANLNEIINKVTDTKDETAQFEAEDISSHRGLSFLAYFSWLVIIPLIAGKDSKYVKFHCNQGILLAIAETILTALCAALRGIPLLGWIFGIVGSLVGIAATLMVIFGIVNVANGKAKELPYIGSVRLIKY